jgi:hypothetical protein
MSRVSSVRTRPCTDHHLHVRADTDPGLHLYDLPSGPMSCRSVFRGGVHFVPATAHYTNIPNPPRRHQVWFLSDRWDVYGQNPDTDRTDVSRLSSGLVSPLDGPLDDLVSDVIGQKNGEFFTRSFVRGQPSISVFGVVSLSSSGRTCVRRRQASGIPHPGACRQQSSRQPLSPRRQWVVTLGDRTISNPL